MRFIMGHIIFIASGLCFLNVLSLVINKGKKQREYYLIGFFSVLTILLFEHYYLNYIDTSFDLFALPLKAFLVLEIRYFKYLFGPLYFLYQRSLLYNDSISQKRALLHFLPFVIVTLLFSIGFFLVIFVDNSLDPPFKPYYHIFEYLSFIHILIYVIIVIRSMSFGELKFSKDTEKLIRISFIISLCIIISLVFFLLDVIPLNNFFSRMGVLSISVLLIILFVLSKKYPELTTWLAIQAKKARYERSVIKGIDMSLLKSRLGDLMEHEKIYRDENLGLETLARKLHITSHQLSEFINNNLRLSFNSFINEYRIKEAKKLLIDEKYLSVLSIAYSVGFNSKSAFYETFKRITNLTPMEYKKKISPDL